MNAPSHDRAAQPQAGLPPEDEAQRVTAVLTVHNRKELTLRCLESLHRQRDHGARVSVVMCDDGSTDGTSEAVAVHFPDVMIVPGDGTLFYSGGMRAAWAMARVDDPDAYLLMNDDTELDDTALRRLLTTWRDLQAERDAPVIVVGTTRDPAGGYSYGGVVQRRIRRLRFGLVQPAGVPRPADTMNANCVLVPREVVDRVGITDEAYSHSMSDYDYGLRARRAGCEVWVAPGTIGACEPNSGFVVESRDVRSEWRRLTSVRHLPPSEWATFTRRWGGPVWPLFWATPYLKRLVRILRRR